MRKEDIIVTISKGTSEDIIDPASKAAVLKLGEHVVAVITIRKAGEDLALANGESSQLFQSFFSYYGEVLF